jgi:hypothetical protein
MSAHGNFMEKEKENTWPSLFMSLFGLARAPPFFFLYLLIPPLFNSACSRRGRGAVRRGGPASDSTHKKPYADCGAAFLSV